MSATTKRFAFFYLAMLLMALCLGNIDYELAKRTGSTRLSVRVTVYNDGGSTESLGFGYTLKYRHQIDSRSGDVTSYRVGPELRGWNIFQVFGARKLFDRQYADVVYYRDARRAEPVVRGSIANDKLGDKLSDAFEDIFPCAVLAGLFLCWHKLMNRRSKVRNTHNA
jgi:hypothetical protein